MKILHTSDWHLGQSFMGKSRQEEHKVFLEWLLVTIEEENIDVLIVAGDIFDMGTPPNYALELYYNILIKLANSLCKYIVITAGNHDSIATLKAPKELLKSLNIYVITTGDEEENQLIDIYDKEKLQAIICAVPFLRDSTIRKSQSAQTLNDKEKALSLGIKEHYNNIYIDAKKISDTVPIIATGHLTTVGAKSSDSEREIYIGGTLDIDSQFLGENFDYVALGHLHENQKVGTEHIRYSGSPIPLSFSEANSQKKVNIITLESKNIDVKEVDIPLYRTLLVFRGDLESITNELKNITDKESWIEIHLKDKNPFDANREIRNLADELGLIILAIKIDKTEQSLQNNDFNVISLEELEPMELFEKRLDKDGVDDEELREELIEEFRVVLGEVE